MGMKNSALMFHYASKGKGRNDGNGEYRGEHGGYSNDYYRDTYDRMAARYGGRERGGRDMYDYGDERYRGSRHDRYSRDMDDDDDDYREHHRKEKHGKKHLTEQTAKEWVDSMENPEDKSKPGEHWNMAQTTQVLKQMKLPYDPVEFYAVMNMMYSDYFGVAKKYGQSTNTDFFVDMTKAWLDDSDTAAGDKKTEMYYSIVAK